MWRFLRTVAPIAIAVFFCCGIFTIYKLRTPLQSVLPSRMIGFLSEDEARSPENGSLVYLSYAHALAARAAPNKEIILALTDLGNLPMALNFWETSLKPLKITNYLFVSSSREACNNLREQWRLPCFVFKEDAGGGHTSMFGSVEFKRKMNIRTFMILDALHLGYIVLHTDVDVIWFKDPLKDIACGAGCDLAVLYDCLLLNAGFVYARPTQHACAVYQDMKTTALTTSDDDQKALNDAVKRVKVANVSVLPGGKYQCGRRYWEDEARTFYGDNPCHACVVIHNNWIVSQEAKVYRFKELHHWVYDGDRYYTSSDRKYITYENPYNGTGSVINIELDALRMALTIGHVLNRTVILPKFHKMSGKSLAACSLVSLLTIRNFDAQFGSTYREHTFMTHPKVPNSIKGSKTKLYLIESNFSNEHFTDERTVDRVKPANPTRGATQAELLAWFKLRPESVLRFHSLYGAVWLDDPSLGHDFRSKLKSGFVVARNKFQI